MAPGRPTRPDGHHSTADDTGTRQHDTTGVLARQQAELDQAQREAAEWRRRAELAEALAAERARTINTQALALRALTASTRHTDPTPDTAPTPPHHATAPRTLWTFLRQADRGLR